MRTSAAVLPSAFSFSSMSAEIGSPLRAVCASSSAAVVNGYGSTGPDPPVVWSPVVWSAAVWSAAVWSATKPPPTE